MAQNKVFLTGRIAIKDIELKGTEGSEYCMFQLSVQRNYKKPEDQYYAEDLLTCKAFKGQAKFLAEYFPKNSYVQIEGTLRKDDNYEKDGQMVYGQMFILVEQVYFPPKPSTNTEEAAATKEAPVKSPVQKTNPLGPKGNSSPFKKK